ncbi:hypothetical protein PLESTB_001191700 [Pleodorina starrii]|uniref:RBR-type E3 ubiquitin transferase n=1 Tax=Pleodorina starrii TaxID=330485 RepID=A0A9W6BSK4_9CHLO|nr:hypothetical protein PLESTB_001191700 [Pleodorina starrii]GLC71479.1 hypothetical protein PLESTF_001120300 [Pleodorina starrii]
MATEAAALRPRHLLDVDTWQTQLEELLALRSVYDEDFRLLAAPGVGQPPPQPAATSSSSSGEPSARGGGGGGGRDRCLDLDLDLEELLAAGPPPELLAADDDAGGGGGPSGSGGGGGGGGLECFVAEALVHVDVPEGGLQLVLQVPPPLPAPPAAAAAAAGAASGGATAAVDGGAATAGAGHGDRAQEVGGGGDQPTTTGPEGWATVTSKRGGGRGGGGRTGGDGGGSSPGCERASAGAGGRRGGRGRGGRGFGAPAAEAGTAAQDGGGGGGRGLHGPTGRGRGRGRGRSAPQQPTCEQATAAAGGADAGDPAAAAADGLAGALLAAPVGTHGKPGEATWGSGVPAASPPPAPPGAVTEARGEAPEAPAAPRPAPAAPAAPSAPTLVPFGASVQFLSPIRVTLTLPASYPASAPPAVELQALWLTPGQAGSLVSELLEQWRAAGGGDGAPILFLWLDWLRSEALPYLGVRQQLVLGGGGGGGGGGCGGGPGAAAAAAPEGLALSLMRYSARREQEKFNESNVSCSICLDEQLGQRCVRLPDCRDAFCSACLTTHLRTQLGEGAVDNMRCPAPTCRRQLPPYVLQQLLSQSEYERWESLTLQRTLDKMEDLVYCPRCREPCLEDRDHCTLCPGCFFSFCSLCEESWHPGSTCLDPEARLALLEERRAVCGEGRGGNALERARREINRRNELKSLALLSSTTQQCPMCSMGVEKTEGCNKMTCAYCGAYFCWRCNKVISGYDHFQQTPGGEGGCVLFEQQEIDRWNARWQAGGRAVEVEQRGAFVGMLLQHDREVQVRLCHCVVCGQRNIKEGGNNNIRCWSCNSHFCYLCRTWLRTKPGAHFGPGRCRQHSDD